MFRRIVYFFIAIFGGLLIGFAQYPGHSTRRSNALFNHKNAKFVVKKSHRVPLAPKVEVDIVEDVYETELQNDTSSYALYMNCVKQNGWMRGIGKILSDEHASHLASYYRFSNKNKAGHWTKVENLNSYGQLVNSQMSTYLVNPFDDSDTNTDPVWKEKLKAVVCWELVGDVSGENCIRENAYDSSGNLIYSYIPVRIAPDKFMGHYVDSYGMPVKFRDSNGARYVVVQLDDNGYEAEVSFIGEDGYPKKDMWNSYISRYTYDNQGFKTSQRSCAADGRLMRDRSGNSGQNFLPNEYGNPLIVTNFDENDNPVRVEYQGYIQNRNDYDEWGRIVKCTYHHPDGSPDIDGFGLHGYTRDYDDRGNVIKTVNIGLDGLPVNDWNGVCTTISKYDEAGNEVFVELRDRNNLLCNNLANICLVTNVFKDSILMDQKIYSTTNGIDTVLNYHHYRDKNKEIWASPDDDRIELRIEDKDGVVVEESYYTMDWKPRMNKEYGYHRLVKDIKREPHKYIEEGRYLDIHNEYADDAFITYINYNTGSVTVYNHYEMVFDSLNYVVTQKFFNGDKLIKQYQQPRSSDFSVTTGVIGVDAMGEMARSHFEDALYYNAYTGNNIKGRTAYIGITNEYGEIAYASDSDDDSSKAYAFRIFGQGENDLDESGNEISDASSFREILPKAYVIEVYDSCAANLGIKSGDVIMQYGDWACPGPEPGLNIGHALREHMFLCNDRNKEMIVMRRNPATNTPEAVTISLGVGMPRDYGFFVHTVPYTQKEKSRYEECFRKNLTDDILKRFEVWTSKDTCEMSFFRPLRFNKNLSNVFGKGIRDDAILLGIVVLDSLGNCFSALGSQDLETMRKYWFAKDCIAKKIWFTTDLKNIQSLEINSAGEEWDAQPWFDCTADRNLSKKCKKLQKEAIRQIEKYIRRLGRDVRLERPNPDSPEIAATPPIQKMAYQTFV